jgi:hypothetical protein
MTNDETLMTKEFPMTNSKTTVRADEVNSSFGLRHSLVIRVSSLVIQSFIPHSAFRTPHF